jgi:hypothetical protein
MKKLLSFYLLISSLNLFAQSNRVLVISGGGSRGAWGGGVAKQFVKDSMRNYRAIFGTSSGSLLAPLIAADKFTEMEEGFTQINQNAIFNENPFRNNGKVKAGRAFIKVLFGSKNLGETKNLRNRIIQFFSNADYQSFRNNNKTVVVSVVSLTTNTLAYKSSDSISDYNRMVNWVWASANQPVFMSSVPMDGELWVDGGIKENVPIEEAIKFAREKAIDTIDVIVLNTLSEHHDRWPLPGEKNTIVPKIMRTINIFSDEIKISDLKIGILNAGINKKIVLNLYPMNDTEFELAPQSLLFIKERQQELWERGRNHKFSINKAVTPTEKIGEVTLVLFN